MDAAYDHIQEENYPQDATDQQADEKSTAKETSNDFNAEIQDAYKAISSSPWAAKIGGFFGTVKKQSEQYYDSASKQYAPQIKSASAGVSNLISHARNLSVQAAEAAISPNSPIEQGAETNTSKELAEEHPDRPESLTADIVKEAEGLLSIFKSQASKRMKEIEKAEDVADEALLKWGTNIRDFLRDAVTVAPPAEGSEAENKGNVLFESKDITGKKVVHATRFDAQLHVIHSTLDSFLKDPASPQWENWKSSFNVEKKTEAIAKDLEKYEELRSAMEKCVPEKVEYAVFWCRYYFLRHIIESEEQRRREMLKGAADPTKEEEVAWDEDSSSSDEDAEEEDEDEDEDDDDDDDDEDEDDDDSDSDEDSQQPKTATPSTSNLKASVNTIKPADAKKPIVQATQSLKLAQKPAANPVVKPAAAKPATMTTPPRRSNDEKSVADSDASYDLVSGATSRAASAAPKSPQDQSKNTVNEESDEEDWE